MVEKCILVFPAISAKCKMLYCKLHTGWGSDKHSEVTDNSKQLQNKLGCNSLLVDFSLHFLEESAPSDWQRHKQGDYDDTPVIIPLTAFQRDFPRGTRTECTTYYIVDGMWCYYQRCNANRHVQPFMTQLSQGKTNDKTLQMQKKFMQLWLLISTVIFNDCSIELHGQNYDQTWFSHEVLGIHISSQQEFILPLMLQQGSEIDKETVK